MNNRAFIIAEAGVNHNGDLGMALKLVDVAAAAGVDAVKFQTFSADRLVTRTARQASYQVKNIGEEEGQYEMLKKLELSRADHLSLIERCRERSISFMSTAFDDASIEMLRSLQVTPWKIPSGEITNLPYLRRIGAFGERIILSTGMATLNEVAAAVDVLIKAGTPKEKLVLLHCTTEYPAPYAEVNLRAMETMKKAFGIPVGYSDHTTGVEIAVAAVALGAVLIEKHFTLDRTLPGPDHPASLEPDALTLLVTSIRNVEAALGDGRKEPANSELGNREVVRKSIVAAKTIRKGEILENDSLTTKRPGSGLSPMSWDLLIGTPAVRDFAPDETIELPGAVL